ncbi:MAG: chemotaxis protein CheW [Myxococcota bacterium]|nr:chemotaxis protein CheW [Myxococcota bacterium]
MTNALVKRDTLLPVGVRSGRAERLRTGEAISEFLVFTLGAADSGRKERMGLPLESVQEILKPTAVTHVPRAPHDVVGILSVRGRITTVLDLRRRLSMSREAPTRHTRILLVKGREEVMGIVVDAVLHVVRLRDDEIEPAAVVGADLPEHVRGLGRPRRRDAVRGVVGQEARGEASEAEVVVLLDPIALLKR